MTTNSKKLSTSPGGSYLLHITVSQAVRQKIGALGTFNFPAGPYVYVGSARRGFDARINRHRAIANGRKNKLHWHIDFLLSHPDVYIERVDIFPGREECELSEWVRNKYACEIPAPGFGASDCTHNCPAHLYRVVVIRENDCA